MTHVTLFAAGVGLAGSAAVLALWAVVSAARAGGPLREQPRRLALVLTAVVMAMIIGLDAVRVSTALTSELWQIGPHPSLQEGLARAADARLAEARTHVVAVGAVGWIAATLVSLRARERPLGWRAASVAGALFVAGLLAFAATRGMAHDARHRIPGDGRATLGCPGVTFDVRSLPVSTRGEPLAGSGLTLELGPREALLSPIDVATSPADLADMLRRQRDLWVQVTGRPASEMARVRVVAPEHLGTTEVALWLRAIEEHLNRGFILVALEPERRFPTRTLGDVAATPHCGGIPVRLDPTGPLLASYPTWGDLVRGHEGGGASISVRLR